MIGSKTDPFNKLDVSSHMNLSTSTLLRKKLREYDAVLMCVSESGPQEYVGVVQKVYSRRHEGPVAYDAGSLAFVGSPGTFGNVSLKNGERALVFLRFISGSSRYYQDPMRGHFSITSRDGRLFAVANWGLLDPRSEEWEPAYLRKEAFVVDHEKPWQVAMPFSLLERHLLEELELLNGEQNV
jgi:hypothetical protein